MQEHNASILLVNYDENLLKSMERTLRREPYQILMAGSADEAANVLVGQPVAGVICDYMMSGMTGVDFLTLVAGEYTHIFRILVTGQPSVQLTMRAINKAGVFRLCCQARKCD